MSPCYTSLRQLLLSRPKMLDDSLAALLVMRIHRKALIEVKSSEIHETEARCQRKLRWNLSVLRWIPAEGALMEVLRFSGLCCFRNPGFTRESDEQTAWLKSIDLTLGAGHKRFQTLSAQIAVEGFPSRILVEGCRKICGKAVVFLLLQNLARATGCLWEAT